LIRSDDFPCFDENIRRLQDWDLWLTMLEKGNIGTYCGKRIFVTYVRNGISFGNKLSYKVAKNIVLRKHGKLNG